MRILLVDDHPLFLQSLKVLLDTSGYEVIGLAGNGMEALKQARLLHPDLVLMDIDMPECDGLAATRLIKAEMPQVKIVMLTISGRDERGGAALPPELAARLLTEFARQAQHIETRPVEDLPANLTPRQVEILTLVTQGHTYPQVGEMLHLSEPTVRYHMGEILERLHLQNRTQVIAYAAQHGLTRK
jgi:two-component system NarL family response regulator